MGCSAMRKSDMIPAYATLQRRGRKSEREKEGVRGGGRERMREGEGETRHVQELKFKIEDNLIHRQTDR